jgi:hypothetical protein
MKDEFRQIGPGRYAIAMTTPWGQAVPAEMILTTARGWADRPEAADGRWATLPVGPVMIALRLGEDAVGAVGAAGEARLAAAAEEDGPDPGGPEAGRGRRPRREGRGRGGYIRTPLRSFTSARWGRATAEVPPAAGPPAPAPRLAALRLPLATSIRFLM